MDWYNRHPQLARSLDWYNRNFYNSVFGTINWNNRHPQLGLWTIMDWYVRNTKISAFGTMDWYVTETPNWSFGQWVRITETPNSGLGTIDCTKAYYIAYLPQLPHPFWSLSYTPKHRFLGQWINKRGKDQISFSERLTDDTHCLCVYWDTVEMERAKSHHL